MAETKTPDYKPLAGGESAGEKKTVNPKCKSNVNPKLFFLVKICIIYLIVCLKSYADDPNCCLCLWMGLGPTGWLEKSRGRRKRPPGLGPAL